MLNPLDTEYARLKQALSDSRRECDRLDTTIALRERVSEAELASEIPELKVAVAETIKDYHKSAGRARKSKAMLDRAVDVAYGRRSFAAEADRVGYLFELYTHLSTGK